MADLEALAKLEREATSGPWGIWCVTTRPQEMPSGAMVPLIHGAAPPHEISGPLYDSSAVKKAADDAALIAAARNALPELLRELKAAREVVEAARNLDIGVTGECCQEAQREVEKAIAAYDLATEKGGEG